MNEQIFVSYMFRSYSVVSSKFVYSRVRNKRSPTIINFLTFFQGLRPYFGLHSRGKNGATIILFAKFSRGLRSFKGVRLFQTLEY